MLEDCNLHLLWRLIPDKVDLTSVANLYRWQDIECLKSLNKVADVYTAQIRMSQSNSTTFSDVFTKQTTNSSLASEIESIFSHKSNKHFTRN